MTLVAAAQVSVKIARWVAIPAMIVAAAYLEPELTDGGSVVVSSQILFIPIAGVI